MFNGRTEDYTCGRPGYAQGAVELLCTKILRDGDHVADIGSGTGIFAGELIARGFDVFCVEPNHEMRRQAERIFCGNRHFISVPGTAEATTLPDASVDAITAASALHWFDTDRFAAESRRILRPGGYLFTVANSRDYRDSFTRLQHELCLELCPGFTSLRHGLEKVEQQMPKILGRNVHHAEFDFPLEYTKEKFIRRSLSSSYAPAANSPTREQYIQKLRQLLDRFAPDSDTLTVPNVTVVYWGQID